MTTAQRFADTFDGQPAGCFWDDAPVWTSYKAWWRTTDPDGRYYYFLFNDGSAVVVDTGDSYCTLVGDLTPLPDGTWQGQYGEIVTGQVAAPETVCGFGLEDATPSFDGSFCDDDHFAQG